TKNNRGVFACPTLNNYMRDFGAEWGGSAGWGSVTYGLTQAFVNLDPVQIEGDAAGGIPCVQKDQSWGWGCCIGTPLPRVGHPGYSILFTEGDVGTGPFFNMQYGADWQAQNLAF